VDAGEDVKPVRTAESNLVYKGQTPDVADLHCERLRPGLIASVWWLTWRYARWQELKRLQRPIADGGEALSLRALARRYRLSAERIRQILEDGPGDYVPEEGTNA
jgi:hypothetical protein